MCGTRVVADDNEQLIQEALIHTYEVHVRVELIKEQVRQKVAEQASDTGDASSYQVRQRFARGYSPNLVESSFSDGRRIGARGRSGEDGSGQPSTYQKSTW